MKSNKSLNEINQLFKKLMKVHKSLIDFQKLVIEAFEQKQYSPYAVLQLAFNHPDFAWLRKISTIMADMDEATSDKENLPTETHLKEFVQRLNDIFSEHTQDDDFKNRLGVALKRDPQLLIEVSELRILLVQHLK